MTQKIPTPTQVIETYLKDREKIKALKRQAKEEVEKIEVFQKKREDFLLKQEANDMDIFSFFTDIYINGRDGKAEKEQEKKDIGLRQEAIEKWLLAMLGDKGKGISTDFGTVYKTRKESVTVEAWDSFLEAEILRPAAEKAYEEFQTIQGMDPSEQIDAIKEVLRTSAHFELLNKAVNKIAALEIMGEKDEKTGARPNPPPAGIKYVALTTVGVRKGK